jgi:hypothetical protein
MAADVLDKAYRKRGEARAVRDALARPIES